MGGGSGRPPRFEREPMPTGVRIRSARATTAAPVPPPPPTALPAHSPPGRRCVPPACTDDKFRANFLWGRKPMLAACAARLAQRSDLVWVDLGGGTGVSECGGAPLVLEHASVPPMGERASASTHAWRALRLGDSIIMGTMAGCAPRTHLHGVPANLPAILPRCASQAPPAPRQQDSGVTLACMHARSTPLPIHPDVRAGERGHDVRVPAH